MKLLSRFKKPARPSQLMLTATDAITLGIETATDAITKAGVDLLTAVMAYERKL